MGLYSSLAIPDYLLRAPCAAENWPTVDGTGEVRKKGGERETDLAPATPVKGVDFLRTRVNTRLRSALDRPTFCILEEHDVEARVDGAVAAYFPLVRTSCVGKDLAHGAELDGEVDGAAWIAHRREKGNSHELLHV